MDLTVENLSLVVEVLECFLGEGVRLKDSPTKIQL